MLREDALGSAAEKEVPPSDGFSLAAYERTLLKAKRLGYAFPTVSELGRGFGHLERLVLLRHDIDVSPLNALEMARLEHRLGVRSSYFVLMHSPFYNPGAAEHWDALREIASLGFEVGLHYEVDFFEARGLDPLQGVLDDAKALGHLLGLPIRSVSQHRPASGSLVREIDQHYVDAYRDELMHGLRYVSDSGFKWRGPTLEDLLGEVDRIHALLHPTTWRFGELDMAGTYREMSRRIRGGIDREFEAFIAATQDYLRRRRLLDEARERKYRSTAAPGRSSPESAGVLP
jgi:hypothetical protein